jgi:hypothetical protein
MLLTRGLGTFSCPLPGFPWAHEEPDPYTLLMVASPRLGSFVARNRDTPAVSCAIFEKVSSPCFPMGDLFLNKTIDVEGWNSSSGAGNSMFIWKMRFSVLKGCRAPFLARFQVLKDLAAVGTMCLRSFKYLIHIHQSNGEGFVWGFGWKYFMKIFNPKRTPRVLILLHDTSGVTGFPKGYAV